MNGEVFTTLLLTQVATLLELLEKTPGFYLITPDLLKIVAPC